MKKALISGVTGQDGSYLAELLIDKGYEVHGLRRRTSYPNTANIDHLCLDPHLNKARLILHYGDMTDSSNITAVVSSIEPDEIYNLAAQSHVHTSFQMPDYTTEVNATGTMRLLEVVKNVCPATKIYQASTSELFGIAQESPQKESTLFNPQSPYAISKLYAYWITKNYRDAYNLHCCNGILFNHESPRRGVSFVTRKITKAVAEIERGRSTSLYLGNLNARRDWGYAKDYVEAMWLMLQEDKPIDLVIATGTNYSVRDFVEEAFRCSDIEIEWTGESTNEKGRNRKTGKILVEVDPYYYRPAEVNELLGDASKARKILNWCHKVKFHELVNIMVESDRLAIENK